MRPVADALGVVDRCDSCVLLDGQGLDLDALDFDALDATVRYHATTLVLVCRAFDGLFDSRIDTDDMH
jgi:hypothetical protein